MLETTTQTAPRLDDPDERLMWARMRAGLENATDAARRYHWNENTYRSHENGTRGLSKKAAAKYARAFKVSTGWLLYGEGPASGSIDVELQNIWDNFTPAQREHALRILRTFTEREEAA